VARFSLSLNEGSLLRRTVLHVGVFVLATAAFLAIASFSLTAIVKGLLLPSEKSAAAAGDGSGDESASSAPAGLGKPSARPPRKKRGSALEQPRPATEEEDQ
jgi:hypothetical protein